MTTSIFEYVYLFVPIDFEVVFSSSLMGYLKHFGTLKLNSMVMLIEDYHFYVYTFCE